jgi:hypothetical protein
VFLYHGTNCYRRWEINRSGSLLSGRSGYSFFSSDPEDAFNYARSACLRDIKLGAANSLSCEPVVLKVRFNARAWIQVDFLKEILSFGKPALLAFVLGPIPSVNIAAVLHCAHGRNTALESQKIRTFADGRLMDGIRKLRLEADKKRLDAWLLAQAQQCGRNINSWLGIEVSPELTAADELHRLAQIGPRLRMGSGKARPD